MPFVLRQVLFDTGSVESSDGKVVGVSEALGESSEQVERAKPEVC